MFKIIMKNKIDIKEKNFNEIKKEYYKLIKYEIDTVFVLNNKILFFDEYFPILEFIFQFETWKEKNSNETFFYSSIETEDNPIITIEKLNNDLYFKSNWNDKLVREKIKIVEIIDEIEKCKKLLFK